MSTNQTGTGVGERHEHHHERPTEGQLDVHLHFHEGADPAKLDHVWEGVANLAELVSESIRHVNRVERMVRSLMTTVDEVVTAFNGLRTDVQVLVDTVGGSDGTVAALQAALDQLKADNEVDNSKLVDLEQAISDTDAAVRAVGTPPPPIEDPPVEVPPGDAVPPA